MLCAQCSVLCVQRSVLCVHGRACRLMWSWDAAWQNCSWLSNRHHLEREQGCLWVSLQENNWGTSHVNHHCMARIMQARLMQARVMQAGINKVSKQHACKQAPCVHAHIHHRGRHVGVLTPDTRHIRKRHTSAKVTETLL